jgi:hypothetical protein
MVHGERTMTMPTWPVRFDGVATAIKSAPLLGEHTAEVNPPIHPSKSAQAQQTRQVDGALAGTLVRSRLARRCMICAGVSERRSHLDRAW